VRQRERSRHSRASTQRLRVAAVSRSERPREAGTSRPFVTGRAIQHGKWGLVSFVART
jgi:hypothetical protein